MNHNKVRLPYSVVVPSNNINNIFFINFPPKHPEIAIKVEKRQKKENKIYKTKQKPECAECKASNNTLFIV